MERHPGTHNPENPEPAINLDWIQENGIDVSINPADLELDLERFAELPNRRQAIQGRDSHGETVFLHLAIAKKLYRCPCCFGDIPIGGEHVAMNRIDPTISNNGHYFDHHHLDARCAHQIVMPGLRDKRIVDSSAVSGRALSTKRRNLRKRRRY